MQNSHVRCAMLVVQGELTKTSVYGNGKWWDSSVPAARSGNILLHIRNKYPTKRRGLWLGAGVKEGRGVLHTDITEGICLEAKISPCAQVAAVSDSR
jgi:hypothetical protein